MFNIFNRRKPIKFYHPELKPGERIEKVLLEFILPELEPLGFRFLKSELCFVRTNGDFVNVISIQKNKWNGGNDVCAFKPYLTIYSSELPKYLGISKTKKKIWFLGDSAEDIDGWIDKYFDNYYNLAAHDNFDLIESFKHILLNVGISYFNNYTTHNDVVNHYILNTVRSSIAPSLFDLCQMKKDKVGATAVISWFEELSENPTKKANQETLKEIDLRKDKLNNWL